MRDFLCYFGWHTYKNDTGSYYRYCHNCGHDRKQRVRLRIQRVRLRIQKLRKKYNI